jgi:peptidyl-prolyl cis-trans isomerase SurA
MILLNKFSALIFLILMFSGAVLPSYGQTVHNIWNPPFRQGIAAQVEGRIITFEELRREMAPLAPRIRQESRSENEFNDKMSQLYVEVLQNLIDREIIVREFTKKEFNLPQTVIENEFDRILIEDFNNDRAAFLEHLQSQGKNVREFRQELYKRIVVSVMRGQMRKTVAEVSPERIESFYNENKIHFYQEEALKLRLILLRPIADESIDLIRQQASRVMKELESGRDFADVAREYSQDTRRERGGDWDWVQRGDLQDDLSAAAFSLNPGTYSQPIEIGSQIFILYAEDYRSEGLQPLHEVRDRIEDILLGQISRQAQRAWIERLRKTAYVRYF